MPEWVVRAGLAREEHLIAAYRRHTGANGIYGFSVQYAPGKSIEELASAGRFPNPKISYAYDDELAASLSSQGYRMALVSSPGIGFHHTFMVLYDADGRLLKRLPADAARTISRTFRQTINPHRVT